MMTGTLAPVSNKETWSDTLEFINDETDAAWFVQASPPDEITLKLRDKSGSIVLTLSLSDGDLVVVGDGQVTFTASADTMGGIEPKTYEVGVLYEDDDVVTQVLLGNISVLDGL